jgi:hypothetical protein
VTPAQKAAQFGQTDLGLTGVSVESLCKDNEESFQLRGQKYSAQIPVIQQKFQLGVSQVACCSSDSCHVAGESNLFPRPQLSGAADMIEGWKKSISSVQWPTMPDLSSLPRLDGYRAPPNAVPIPVYPR